MVSILHNSFSKASTFNFLYNLVIHKKKLNTFLIFSFNEKVKQDILFHTSLRTKKICKEHFEVRTYYLSHKGTYS